MRFRFRLLCYVSTLVFIGLSGSSTFAHHADQATPAAPQAASPAQPAAAAPAVQVPVPEDLAQPPADAITSPSGLVSRVLTAGAADGTKPGPGDMATFHYALWTSDGNLFDSTLRRRRPATLFLDRIMPGMSEGVQLMVPGEKRRLWIPQALAFKGEKGKPEGTLVLDVELVSWEPSPKTPPRDVMAPPEDATKLPNGLAFRVLRPGTGTVMPKKSSRVTVHYTGWTTDGEMFDSSVMRGQPATFGLDEVIRGWTEGVALMVEGEKRRFWIPSRMAYNNEPGRPRGMLVFDVELIKIEKQ
jgi:peptidylprolyl isomerase